MIGIGLRERSVVVGGFKSQLAESKVRTGLGTNLVSLPSLALEGLGVLSRAESSTGFILTGNCKV